MTTKTYTSRDSATSALRKIGIQSRDYNLFISKVNGKFECKISLAIAHFESLSNLAKPKAVAKPAPAASTKKTSISATARSLILDGKTNQEVWEIIKSEFNLDDSKKHYPTWYRCEMKRTGMISAA
jgi:hypothetical protein